MSLKFYYAPMTTSGITESVIAELGVPCEKVKLDLKSGDTRKPDFLRVNPNGLVPAIEHEGTAIWESAAITMYLGETFGVEKKLYPAPGPKRGEAMKWIVWSNVQLADAAARLMRHASNWTPKEQQNAAEGEKARADVMRHLGVLDRALEGREWLTGSEYTLADAHLGSVVHWVGMLQPLDAHPRVQAFAKKFAERPAVKSLSRDA